MPTSRETPAGKQQQGNQHRSSSSNQSIKQSYKQLRLANPPIGIYHGNSLQDDARAAQQFDQPDPAALMQPPRARDRGRLPLDHGAEHNQGRRGKDLW
jgi:hypothetical protein